MKSFGFPHLLLLSTVVLSQSNVVLSQSNQAVQIDREPSSKFSQMPHGEFFVRRAVNGTRERAYVSNTAQTSRLGFSMSGPYPSEGSGGPPSVAVADLNGDGIPDMVAASACDASGSNCGIVSVLLGHGDGTFKPAVVYNSGGYQANFVAIADVNGDGKPDLVVSNYFASRSNFANGAVGVLLGNGDGTFQTATTYNSGAQSTLSVAIADVNGDGKPDLLVASACAIGPACSSTVEDGVVSVLLNNGDGTFQTAVTYDSGGEVAGSVAVADVNGDGKPDLLVSDYCTSSTCSNSILAVLLGNGNGTFQTAVTYNSGVQAAVALALSDLNGDGNLDAVVAGCPIAAGCAGGAVGVLLGNGDGTFQTGLAYSSGGVESDSVVVADVSGDGIPDIEVANLNCVSGSGSNCRGNVGVLLGNGNGTFQTAVTFGSGDVYTIYSVAAADLNGDGKPDLVASALCSPGRCFSGIGQIGVLINASIGAATTTLVSSPNPSNLGKSVTFTATVTAGTFFKHKPTGTVSFFDGTTSLGSVPLSSSGVETIATSKLAVGTHHITATYSGDANFLSSTSPVLSQVVQGAIAHFSATGLNFGNQTVGITSVARNVTLTNQGNIALTIASMGITGTNSGDFVATHCPSSIAPMGTCTFSVTFNPGAPGTRTAAVSVIDNASGSPQKVSLAGVGVVPVVTLSSTSLNFPTQVVYTTSKSKTVKLTNSGLGVLKITKVTVTGPFNQTNNCGSTLNSGSSCTLTVTFKPITIGALSATVSITDNAPLSPQNVTLKGTGTAVQLTPPGLNFGNQPVGTASLAQTITLSNKSHGTVNITGISITGVNAGDFHQTHTCGTTVASGASCFIKVTFKPSATGSRTAAVSISDNGGGSPQKVNLTGTGT